MTCEKTLMKQATEKFNSPFFCYDLDSLEKHLQDINSKITEGIKIWYSIKANPLSAVIAKFVEHRFVLISPALANWSRPLRGGGIQAI